MNTSLIRVCLLAAGIAHAVAFAGVKLNGAGVTYATIQAAVTAAGAGDRLHVSTGAYVETVIISNKNITIEGKYSAADYTTKVPAGTTVVNGGALGSVFTLLPPAKTLFVDLSITNGSGNRGGGVKMDVATTATFVSCTIARNYVTSYGGGIYADLQTALILTNAPVQDSSARSKGGGLRCRGLCILDGGNTQVAHNFAPEGGGIAMYSGSMRLQNNADIFDNSAVTRGGGLLVEDADVLITGIGTVLGVNPEKNWVTNGNGGGICAFNSTLVISNQARLQNNFASGDGGGAYLSNCTFNAVDLANIGGPLNTLSNYAMGNGGALYAMDSVINVSTSTVCMGYAGGNGGGIYALRSTVTLADGAQLGLPASAWRNYAGMDGDGLYASASRVLLRNAAVQNNLAGGDCGGIYLDSATRLIVSNSSFIANRATPGDPSAAGGAIYTVDGQSYAELYAVQMLSNVVDDFGGAIYWDSASNLLIKGASVINDNHAGVDGGAIYKDNFGQPDSVLQLDAVQIYRNTCSNSGGAIFLYDGLLRCTDCDVRYNVADKDSDGTGNGGGIYLGSSVTADYAAVKTGYLGANWAAQGGGVYINNNAMLTLGSPTNVVLQLASNRALAGAGGAAYLRNGARLNVQGDVWLSSNNATDDGGAIIGPARTAAPSARAARIPSLPCATRRSAGALRRAIWRWIAAAGLRCTAMPCSPRSTPASPTIWPRMMVAACFAAAAV
ncbi:MAG: hypothetical protein NTV22_08285 [bacterium]|nr:hypothetical protein [bacterium]